MHKKLITILILAFLSVNAFAQFSTGNLNYYRNNPLQKKAGIGLGGGGTFFMGDLKEASEGKISPAINLKLDYRLSRSFGLELNIGAGILAERYKDPLAASDFDSYFGQGYLNLRYHLDNILNLNSTATVSPFLSSGIGYMFFESYVNIKDENGDPYQFHEDGTITNIDGKEVTRDTEFETPLNKDDEYANKTPIFPLGAGFKFNFSEHIELITEASMFYTNHDKIDGYLEFHKTDDGRWKPNEDNNTNDRYIYGSLTFIYNLGYSENRAQRFVPPIIR